MADLDVGTLEAEIASLRAKRAQVRERLDAGRGRGRGRAGPGLGPGRGGVFARLGLNGAPREPPAPGGSRTSVFDRLHGRGGPPGGRDERGPEREPPGGRLSGGLGSGDGSGGGWEVPRPRRRAGDEHDHRDRSPPARLRGRLGRPSEHSFEPPATLPGAASGGRKRLASAVMVNGEARQLGSGAAEVDARGADGPNVDEPPAKRPAVAVDDSGKKRARRMLGALLVGTLQKFKDEDAAFRQSTTAQRRQEIQQRAVEKAEAEAVRIREEAAAARKAERSSGISELMDINLQADTKALELRYARALQRRQQLQCFCATAAQPALYWAPAQRSEATDALMQAQAGNFEAWKQAQLEQLAADKAALAERMAERKAAALARIERGPRRGGEAEGDVEQPEGEGEQPGDEDGAAGDGAEAGGSEQADEQQADEGDAGYEEQQEGSEQPEEAPQPRRKQRRQVNSDGEEEERLLSSDDEDL